MNGFRHTNVGAAAAITQYVRLSEMIDQDHVYYVDSGSANTYAITPNPAIAAYEEGQRFIFRATNANSGASTLNVNALGAIAIQTPDGTALVSGAILEGGYYEVVYDANTAPDRWVLMSPASEIPDGMLSSNVPLKNAANAFAGGQSITAGDFSVGLRVAGATGVVRLLGYTNATNGVLFDALNIAESAYIPFTLQGSKIRLVTDGANNADISLNGVSAADFARKSQANTFTNATQTLSTTDGDPQWAVTDGTVTAQFQIDSTNDWLQIGTTVAHVVRVFTNSEHRLEIGATGNFNFFAGTVTTANTSASEVGYKGAPVNGKTADHTIVAADSGQVLRLTSSADDITVQSSGAPPAGAVVGILNKTGGSIDIIQGSGMTLTLAGTASTGSRTLANEGMAYVYFDTTSTATVGGAGVA